MLTRRSRIARAPLPGALLLLAVGTTALAAVLTVLLVRETSEHPVLVGSLTVGGGAFVLVGSLAWSRRPYNRTGALLCVTGLLTLGSALAGTDLPPVLVALGLLLGEAPIAAALHVVLAFPSGRLPTRIDRGIVVALYVAVLVRQLPVALGGPTLEGLRDACSAVGTALLLAAAARLVLRVRSTPRGSGERRVLGLVYGYGMGLLLFLPFSARVLAPLLHLDPTTLAAVQSAGFFVVPFVFAAGVLRGGFVRTGELESLVDWLGSADGRRTPLRDALATALGDPSLEVLFARPLSGHLVDVEGHAATVDRGPGRGVVRVHAPDGAETGATLVYDTTLYAEPSRVEQAAGVVAVALEQERLRADLLAEQQALRTSRARVVEVGDEERRRLAQDLHDEFQSRLTLAALQAGRLAAGAPDERTRAGLTALRTDLDALMTNLREIVHGVMPALLVERGLAAAAEDLVDRVPIPTRLELRGAERLPPALASGAYFILAEALTNAVRHAGASTLHVVVSEQDGLLRLRVCDDGIGGARPTGAGLRGIADRVDALGGRLDVRSPAGDGTVVEVVLPCAS